MWLRQLTRVGTGFILEMSEECLQSYIGKCFEVLPCLKTSFDLSAGIFQAKVVFGAASILVLSNVRDFERDDLNGVNAPCRSRVHAEHPLSEARTTDKGRSATGERSRRPYYPRIRMRHPGLRDDTIEDGAIVYNCPAPIIVTGSSNLGTRGMYNGTRNTACSKLARPSCIEWRGAIIAGFDSNTRPDNRSTAYVVSVTG